MQSLMRCETMTNYRSDPENEMVVQLKELPKEDQDEVIQAMQDWETYMYCKEAQERVRALTEDLPPVRHNGDLYAKTIIYFKVIDERSKTKNIALGIRENSCSNEDIRSLVPNFTNIEIRPRENWDEDISDEKKEDRLEKARIYKAKGNKAYEAKDYKKACELYSNCISYGVENISIAAYNNRAQTNIKLENFTSAISDLNQVLKTEPRNEKALFRRATCRKELRMYREALKDIDTLSRCYPEDWTGRTLRAEIEKILSTLTGKSYRLRENFGYPETFQVDESQLLAYAKSDQEYLIEVDKNGCLKKCVCNHCTFEDRSNFQSNNRLRIERPKWRPLTPKLLEDIGISQKLTANSSSDNESGSKENGNVSQAAIVKNVCTSSSSTNNVKSNNVNLLNRMNEATSATQNEETFSVRKAIRTRRMKTAGASWKAKIMEKEKTYENELIASKLTDSLNFACKFNLPDEWELMSERLKSLTRSGSFTTSIEHVDKRTLSDVSNLLKLAVDLKLESAEELKAVFSR